LIHKHQTKALNVYSNNGNKPDSKIAEWLTRFCDLAIFRGTSNYRTFAACFASGYTENRRGGSLYEKDEAPCQL
jgi:hypothetical protein